MSSRATLCVAILVVLCLIGASDTISAGSENDTAENRMLVGTYKEVAGEVDLDISCSVGIEQWEDGRKSDDVFHVWHFVLDSTDAELYMGLQIDRYTLLGRDTSIVNSYAVNTINELLTTDLLDVEEGLLRFEFRYSEEDINGVSVNIKFITEDGNIYLTRFKSLCNTATSFDNELLTIEYKIPEYSVIKSVPVKLSGFKTVEQRKYDEMLSLFTDNDKAVFEKLSRYIGSEEIKRDIEDRTRKMFPGYTLDDIDSGRVQLSETEMARFLGMWKDAICECCVKEGMSAESTTRVTAYFEQFFIKN